ncbi:DUF4157 domain-containing protein [Halogeometricum borinquense]|uniref:DUF4157 domain-containing protein n=2 Tax=Halogeometricum borinquense TaxID=60847 RepID=A0A6C0UN30_9EURY|nr:DUF4157 domain-containing protein [Halogeometricum borinquense]
MEDRMGDNLGDVRIHTGPSAAKACEDINARAFTVGNHIAFNHGEYDPSSAESQHILAHELAHVRQQTGGAVSMLPQEGSLEIDPDPRLEREAEETAQRVMQGGKIGVHRMEHSDVHVQRSVKDTLASKAKGLVGLDDEQDLEQYIESKVDERMVQAREAGEQSLAWAKGVKDGSVEALGTTRSKAAQGWKQADARTGGYLNAATAGTVGGVTRYAGGNLGKELIPQVGSELVKHGGQMIGNEFVGSAVGAVAGTLIHPVAGTAVGAQLGKEAAKQLGGAIGSSVSGSVTSTTMDKALPEKHSEAVEDLYQKFNTLEQQVQEMRRGGDTGSGDSTGDLDMDMEYEQ